eukprot:213882-Ditylum_brightwellii.AAC.1
MDITVQVPKNYIVVSEYTCNKYKTEIQMKQAEIHKIIEEKENEFVSLRQRNAVLQLQLFASSIVNRKKQECISKLKIAIAEDAIKTTLGEQMLSVPTRFKQWNGKKQGWRLYGLACAQIPSVSSKYLQITIPMFIAAFFHDVGISEFFDNHKFIPLCTPCD